MTAVVPKQQVIKYHRKNSRQNSLDGHSRNLGINKIDYQRLETGSHYLSVGLAPAAYRLFKANDAIATYLIAANKKAATKGSIVKPLDDQLKNSLAKTRQIQTISYNQFQQTSQPIHSKIFDPDNKESSIKQIRHQLNCDLKTQLASKTTKEFYDNLIEAINKNCIHVLSHNLNGADFRAYYQPANSQAIVIDTQSSLDNRLVQTIQGLSHLCFNQSKNQIPPDEIDRLTDYFVSEFILPYNSLIRYYFDLVPAGKVKPIKVESLLTKIAHHFSVPSHLVASKLRASSFKKIVPRQIRRQIRDFLQKNPPKTPTKKGQQQLTFLDEPQVVKIIENYHGRLFINELQKAYQQKQLSLVRALSYLSGFGDQGLGNYRQVAKKMLTS